MYVVFIVFLFICKCIVNFCLVGNFVKGIIDLFLIFFFIYLYNCIYNVFLLFIFKLGVNFNIVFDFLIKLKFDIFYSIRSYI